MSYDSHSVAASPLIESDTSVKSLLFLLAILAGVATSAQAVINTQLRARLGDPMQAATVSFTVGAILCWLYCLLSRSPLPSLTSLRSVPWWMWTGGAMGALYVWTSIVVTRQIGVAAMLGLLVAGQMLTSLVIEHYGLFHSPLRPASLTRVAGAGLVVFGVCLMAYSTVRKP